MAEDKKDLWLVYEVCSGRTMNEGLFDVKGKYQFYFNLEIWMF